MSVWLDDWHVEMKENQKKWRKIFPGSTITIQQIQKKKKVSLYVCVGGQVSFEVHIVNEIGGFERNVGWVLVTY